MSLERRPISEGIFCSIPFSWSLLVKKKKVRKKEEKKKKKKKKIHDLKIGKFLNLRRQRPSELIFLKFPEEKKIEKREKKKKKKKRKKRGKKEKNLHTIVEFELNWRITLKELTPPNY